MPKRINLNQVRDERRLEGPTFVLLYRSAEDNKPQFAEGYLTSHLTNTLLLFLITKLCKLGITKWNKGVDLYFTNAKSVY